MTALNSSQNILAFTKFGEEDSALHIASFFFKKKINIFFFFGMMILQ